MNFDNAFTKFLESRTSRQAAGGVLLGTSFLLFSCGSNFTANRNANANTAGEYGFPRQIQIDPASSVTIPRKPQRIVSLSVGSDEILCALVDEKRIAGLSKYSQDQETSNVSAEAARIGIFVDRNAEQIINLQPDLILAARYTKSDLKSLLAQTGTPIVSTTNFQTFADIESNIRLLAKAVGEDERGETVIEEMRRKIAGAKAKLAVDKRDLRILFVTSDGVVAGRNTTMNEIINAAGLKNAAETVEGNIKTAPEQITEMNPDIILIPSGYEADIGFRQMLETNPQYSALVAVKEKRIVELPSRSTRTVSHYIADAVETLVGAVNQLSEK